MLGPDDRFSQVAGMRADGAVPVESTTYGEAHRLDQTGVP